MSEIKIHFSSDLHESKQKEACNLAAAFNLMDQSDQQVVHIIMTLARVATNDSPTHRCEWASRRGRRGLRARARATTRKDKVLELDATMPTDRPRPIAQ